MKKSRKEFVNKLFDCHVHCDGLDIFNYIKYMHPTVNEITSVAEIIQKSKIDNALVFPVQSTFYYNPLSYIERNAFFASGLCNVPYEIENKRILLGRKKFECEHLLPFLSFSLNDKIDEQIKYMQELIDAYEVYGLKYHTETDRNLASKIMEYPQLIEFIEVNDLPILFHTGKSRYSDPCAVLELAENFPHIRMCVAHFARFKKEFFERYNPNKFKNVYLDIAPFDLLCELSKKDLKEYGIDTGKFEKEKVLEEIWKMYPDNIIWGSDLPWIESHELESDYNFTKRFSYSEIVATLFKVDEQIYKKIASDNIVDFLFGK